MIDDATHPLAKLVAGATTEKVYLPVKPSLRPQEMESERHACRPDVVAAAEAYFDDPDRLHGDTAPDLTIMHERPVHRMMIYMHAQGKSPKDIAQLTGYKEPTIYRLFRQPWARQRLVQIIKESGGDEVKHFLASEVAPSLHILREIRDGDIPGKTSDRLQAADKILDRALGKPTVHVESDNITRNVPDDLQRLEAELAQTRQQIADRGLIENGNGTN
mgnify:CR=1 FL=1